LIGGWQQILILLAILLVLKARSGRWIDLGRPPLFRHRTNRQIPAVTRSGTAARSPENPPAAGVL
ncbi:MAG: hypothetical protein ACFN9G_12175, partial [Cardiobacterium sp.]